MGAEENTDAALAALHNKWAPDAPSTSPDAPSNPPDEHHDIENELLALVAQLKDWRHILASHAHLMNFWIHKSGRLGRTSMNLKVEMSQHDFGKWWSLYSSMVPAILEGSGTDTLPCLLCHHHHLKQIDFVDVFLISIILLNSTEAELMTIMGFETPDDSSIKRLDM